MADHQKYRITARIDAGGMAEVFRGIAESIQGFKKSVAIKRILPHLTKNRKFISMFLDEARLSLHLQHANIVSIFDIGVAGEGAAASYFIVMEFVDGTHLKGLVESTRRQGRPLAVSQVVYAMMQVCAGLAYAHDFADPETGRPLGIVHRDISPPNILISKNGEVKLVDFGLAKATSQLESTDPGVVKGKFSYLSPEAASGREVDRRADIFAVGILLYELLTGKRLFYGETDYQTVELVRQARVPSIQQQNPDVEPELETIVRKALARDLSARYQTAGEVQDALAHYLFSRGLKVTSRDIAELVRACQAERASNATPSKQSLLDTLILEELNKFTSLEGEVVEGGAAPAATGLRPLSPEELSPPGRTSDHDTGPLIDTSSWTTELADERSGPVPTALSPVPEGQSAGGPRVVSGPLPMLMRAPPPQPRPEPEPQVEEPLQLDTLDALDPLDALDAIEEMEPEEAGSTGPYGAQPAVQEGRPRSAMEVAPHAPISAPASGTPLVMMLAAVVALLLIAGGAVIWLLRSGSTVAP